MVSYKKITVEIIFLTCAKDGVTHGVLSRLL